MSTPKKALGAAMQAEHQRRHDGWRDISTAPKDGTGVLIAWLDRDGEWQTRLAWWEREFQIADVDDDDNTVWKSAWTDNRVQSFGYEEIWEYDPTHWMPLPDPPGADGEAA